jgi:succinate dehydrogenase / fumarate reductase flavoprotein subunit
MALDSKIPAGPIAEWTNYKDHINLVNPANKRNIILLLLVQVLQVVCCCNLAELDIKIFCFQDSPRRAHSIAAQGGINAAKLSRRWRFNFPFVLRYGKRRLPLKRS